VRYSTDRFMNKEDTAIIFGTSPFINKMNKDDIQYLIDNYYHIGINTFVQDYPVKNILFSDYAMYDLIKPNIDNQNIIISQTAYDFNFIKENREKPKNIEYIFDANSEIFHDLSLNMLCMYKTSALPAINYAYLKNYKNIILCGVDLTQTWNHYHNTYGGCYQNRPLKRINLMRNLLYQFKEYVNLYTLNLESDLEIEKIGIDRL